MALTEIFRSADLRKRLPGARKRDSSATKIFRIPCKQKKKLKRKVR